MVTEQFEIHAKSIFGVKFFPLTLQVFKDLKTFDCNSMYYTIYNVFRFTKHKDNSVLM